MNGKLHPQILRTGMKNTIPNFWERELKNPSKFSGTGMGGWYSREWSETGNPAHPWSLAFRFCHYDDAATSSAVTSCSS